MRTNALKLLILLGFTVGAIGCGEIQMPMTLAVEEGSAITIGVPGFGPGGTELVLGTTYLEGGVETTVTADIDLISLLKHNPIFGVVEFNELLFAGSEFPILGIPSGTICTVPDPNGTLGGSALIDIFAGHIDFAMDLDTAIKVTNPDLNAAIPDGFPFTISVSDGVDVGLPGLLQLLTGNADGVISITQPLDVSFVTEVVPGVVLPLHITGGLTLTTVNEFPTGLLIDECIAFLEE